MSANLDEASFRIETHDGRATLVVPVIMARSDVVMNGGLFPAEEMRPETWNGVPVTVQHPDDGAGFISANATPETLTEWTVGRVFNSRVDGPALKGEAWIDIEKATKVAPGLLAMAKQSRLHANIRQSRPIDVSVGFFSEDVAQSGEVGGRPYSIINRNVNPDHLALLPGAEGACSWADGCGVRANERNPVMSGTNTLAEKLAAMGDTLKTALGLNKDVKVVIPADEAGRKRMVTALGHVFNVNERGSDDDRRQMVADLISNDDSPFVPDDEDSLRMMSPDTLQRMHQDYAASSYEEEEPEEEEPETNEEGEDEGGEKEENDTVTTNIRALPKTPKQFSKAVSGAVAAALKVNRKREDERTAKIVAAALKEALPAMQANVLTADQKTALEQATKLAANRRTELIQKIKTNSTMEAAWVDSLDTPTLERIAAGLHPAADYSGRVISVKEGDNEDAEVKSMTAGADFHASSLAAAREKRAGGKG